MISSRKAVVGEPAPGFQGHAILDGRIKDISLKTYTESNHWLVLIFFPRAWSFICPTEIRSFSARLEEFLYSRSCAVVFASTDSEYCLRAWNGTSELDGGLGGVHVPLVSDASHRLSANYGVLNEVDGTAQRALFIIDPKGILRSMSVNDVDVGRSVDEVLRVVDALAFKDEFSEGCPVDWKKGDRGIDISSRSRVDGPLVIEARKSWTDWARPKLQRAWSGNSQRSAMTHSKTLSTSTDRGTNYEDQGSPLVAALDTSTSPYRATVQQRPHSTYVSSHSPGASPGRDDTRMDDAVSNFRREHLELGNENAMAANRAVGAAL